jgi:hypothetical protein
MMTTRMRMMTMWTKFIYVCNDCDALIEVTASVSPQIDPACICQASSHVTLISWEDATVSHVDEDPTPDYEPVIKVTPREVVKINTNPYN